jgi:hypothetical protein
MQSMKLIQVAFIFLLLVVPVYSQQTAEKSTLDEIGGYALAVVDGVGLKWVETLNITVEPVNGTSEFSMYVVAMDLTVYDIESAVLGYDLNQLGMVANKIIERYNRDGTIVKTVHVSVIDRSRVDNPTVTVDFHPTIAFETGYAFPLGPEPILKTRLN